VPDPKTLRVGDLVRFVSIPEEWSQPGYRILPESVEFMERMIQRAWPSRVYEIDEFGHPWIAAKFKDEDNNLSHHWAIMESIGWRRVRRRKD